MPTTIRSPGRTERLRSITSQLAPVRATTWLAVAYVVWLVWTPYVRFDILVAISFERILAILMLAAVVLFVRRIGGDRRIVIGVLLFATVSYLSWLTAGRSTAASTVWAYQYWKDVMFFLLLCGVASDERDAWKVPVFIVIVVTLYQLYSLLDFLAGGSYVYQQGTKRFMGIWAARSYGSANAMAKWSLVSFAIALPFLRPSLPKAWRMLSFLGISSSTIAIVLTGSRASVLILPVLVAIWFRHALLRPRIVFTVVGAALLIWNVLPETLRERYAGIAELREVIATDAAETVAEQSALGRLQGLLDGVALWRQHPVLGVGPGNSAVARIELRPNDPTINPGGSPLALHSLYGQVLAETGAVGTLPFVILVLLTLGTKRGSIVVPPDGMPSSALIDSSAASVRMAVLSMLGFGFASHSLFQDVWLLLFACAALLGNYRSTAAGRKRHRPVPTHKNRLPV